MHYGQSFHSNSLYNNLRFPLNFPEMVFVGMHASGVLGRSCVDGNGFETLNVYQLWCYLEFSASPVGHCVTG